MLVAWNRHMSRYVVSQKYDMDSELANRPSQVN